jgi:hypothetical protein
MNETQKLADKVDKARDDRLLKLEPQKALICSTATKSCRIETNGAINYSEIDELPGDALTC